ncbi:magnesium chelatase [Marinomonas ushuaiensis DSM 15871]|uniref:Magnesium chelatase n=1 Tax=Marinomonas ushuaiensis DSM 15871 TaxID=1122207 RepID=X7E4P7_9GAMM|nr:ATP-binding protein [Marinomonas ushuaiensis]ETX10840.1 magnesium chelatase [Marinomonas ushuaiensis DSM 15871]
MTSLAHSNFPFTAVAGQEPLKLALILCAINPQIDGVLISGPRGSAKSTLARGLSGVMPALLNDEELAPFATLPLGTSEDRLLGALDLEQVLQDKQVAFKPGLLSKAHGGVLYVDEVNLLADHLVDQLLDVAASGVNRVERDGISHEHQARFLLIGTMNPDEGELRPQLQDRFGLMVQLSNQYSLEERVQIVRLRDEFDQDPESFSEAFKYKQRNLKNSIRLARNALNDINCSDALRMEVATRCQAANIDGVRGDIVWIRAAMTYAAWRGAKQVTIDDIKTVEELVLAHRRQAKTQPPSSSTPPPSRRPDQSRSENHQQDQQRDSQDIDNKETGESEGREGDWGSMTPQLQKSSEPIRITSQDEKKATSTVNRLREVTPGKSKGKQQGGYRPDITKSGSGVDWFRSIINQPQEWPPKKLAHKAAKTGQAILHLVLLDTSASTLSQGVFAKAKGVILDIADRAYVAREQIAILGFGQDGVSSILPRVRAPKVISELLDNLGAGGGTPFRIAIENASDYLAQQHKSNAGLHSQTYILTDGRTQADVSDLELSGHTVLIDIENAPVKRGRGQDIAQHLGAQYIPLNSLLETHL